MSGKRAPPGQTDGRTRAPRPTHTGGHPLPHSPSGLMVLSGDSLSLELPLDMRAAMEKALAREESCGLGGGVYSMATRRRSSSARRCPDREYRGQRSAVTGRAEGKHSAPGAARSPALTRGRGDPIGRWPIGGGTRQGPRPGRGGGGGGGREEEEEEKEGEGWDGLCPPAGWARSGRISGGLPTAAPPSSNRAPLPPRLLERFGVRPPLL